MHGVPAAGVNATAICSAVRAGPSFDGVAVQGDAAADADDPDDAVDAVVVGAEPTRGDSGGALLGGAIASRPQPSANRNNAQRT